MITPATQFMSIPGFFAKANLPISKAAELAMSASRTVFPASSGGAPPKAEGGLQEHALEEDHGAASAPGGLADDEGVPTPAKSEKSDRSDATSWRGRSGNFGDNWECPSIVGSSKVAQDADDFGVEDIAKMKGDSSDIMEALKRRMS